VSCAQAMISRPIVAGPLAGLLLGDPISGMWAGALLEILSLRQLPIGANRGWDTGPAAVAAAAVAALWGGGAVALMLAVAFGVIVGRVGSWTVHILRHFNSSFVANEARPLETPSRVTVWHLSALAVDLLRATALTAVAVLVLVPLDAVYSEAPSGWAGVVAAVAVLGTVSLGVGVDVRMMARGRRMMTAAGIGAVLGLVLGLWLR
jgi:mannose/fructose/N-acetylgalactosamine-specific phosphotransferase system component IIC